MRRIFSTVLLSMATMQISAQGGKDGGELAAVQAFIDKFLLGRDTETGDVRKWEVNYEL